MENNLSNRERFWIKNGLKIAIVSSIATLLLGLGGGHFLDPVIFQSQPMGNAQEVRVVQSQNPQYPGDYIAFLLNYNADNTLSNLNSVDMTNGIRIRLSSSGGYTVTAERFAQIMTPPVPQAQEIMIPLKDAISCQNGQVIDNTNPVAPISFWLHDVTYIKVVPPNPDGGEGGGVVFGVVNLEMN